jgi:3-mercaptopyruvate sulfurtransferase SseA
MSEEIDWHAKVKGILKAELKRRNVTYRQLAEKLGEIGVHETERNINNKISRGGFSAAFFVQCLLVAGCQSVRLTDD